VSAPFLLDASAVIALTLSDHEHHDRAAAWAVGVDRFALCPVVEGALVRFLLRLGQTQQVASSLLDSLYASGRFDFWPDEISYREADLLHVRGHRQVTDAYLAALAARHGAVLATFDEALVRTLPNRTQLIP
jgi:uncharacterized protein